MGQLFYMAVMARDYPTVMGILLIGAILTLLGNLIADVSVCAGGPAHSHLLMAFKKSICFVALRPSPCPARGKLVAAVKAVLNRQG